MIPQADIEVDTNYWKGYSIASIDSMLYDLRSDAYSQAEKLNRITVELEKLEQLVLNPPPKARTE